MKTIVATDLDGTVLYSLRAMGADPPAATDLLGIDIDGLRTYAYMTTLAADRWRRLTDAGVVVPATTRSVEQYLRLRLPGRPPRAAVVCNGARLLLDGETDPAWERSVRQTLATVAAPFAVVLRQATVWHTGRGFASLRTVEDFFVYLTATRREPWLETFAHEADSWVAAHGWRASLQGHKLYLIPAALDKAAAVAELVTRLGGHRMVAGGDSRLDEQMLRAAHAAIRPAHGELHRAGFSVPHCRTTVARGAGAGDEILEWYAEQVGMV